MRNLIIYDNGGDSLDRYTIIKKKDYSLNREGMPIKYSGRYLYDCLCASEYGGGVFMTGTAIRGPHLGKKVSFSGLSTELQNKIKQYYL